MPFLNVRAGFRLTSNRVRHRWERLALARRLGAAIPPIEPGRVGDLHFVNDGHHRVSIAGAAAGLAGSPQAEPQAWVARLSRGGAERDAAVAELHDLLLRAARFEIRRRRAVFPHLGGADLDDLAWQARTMR